MNKLYIGTALIGATMLGIIGSPVIYKSVGITEEAKGKVVSQALQWNMTQQDTVSRMVMEYGTTTPNEYQKYFEDWKVYYQEQTGRIVE